MVTGTLPLPYFKRRIAKTKDVYILLIDNTVLPSRNVLFQCIISSTACENALLILVITRIYLVFQMIGLEQGKKKINFNFF